MYLLPSAPSPFPRTAALSSLLKLKSEPLLLRSPSLPLFIDDWFVVEHGSLQTFREVKFNAEAGKVENAAKEGLLMSHANSLVDLMEERVRLG